MSGVMVVKINQRELIRFAANLKRAEAKFPALSRSVLSFLGDRLTQVMRRESRPIRYTGAFESSINYRLLNDNVAVVGPNVRGVTVPWITVKWIHFGGPPRNEDINDLMDWAEFKLGDRMAAYPIQEMIRQRGTSQWQVQQHGDPGFPFLELTMNSKDTLKAGIYASKRLGRAIIMSITGKSGGVRFVGV